MSSENVLDPLAFSITCLASSFSLRTIEHGSLVRSCHPKPFAGCPAARFVLDWSLVTGSAQRPRPDFAVLLLERVCGLGAPVTNLSDIDLFQSNERH